MKQTIPSSFVGLKINEWYTHIRQFHVLEAERVKREVERDRGYGRRSGSAAVLFINGIQTPCHAGLHQALKEDPSQPEFSELLEDIEGNQYKLTGLLDYYFNFFRGMYEFKQKMFLNAMMYYKRAEKTLHSFLMTSRKLSLLLKWPRFLQPETNLRLHELCRSSP